jgi:ATP-binding cassette subfamily B (MDR/TAP) protein 1
MGSVDASPKDAAASTHTDQSRPSEKGHDDEKPSLSPSKAYFRLWTYANYADISLRLAGTVAFLATGTAMPIMTIIFGRFVNDFNDWGSGGSTPEILKQTIGKNALYLVYIFIGRFAASYLGAMLYNVTSSRIARKIRLQYVDKVMHQPIAYFDRHSTGSISTDLTADVNQIELGLGEKSGLILQGSSMIISAFTIALTKNWKLALACMTVVPWTILVTGPMAGIDTKVETRIKAAFSEASGIVEEALSSIANVTALGASGKIVANYRKFVDKAAKQERLRGFLWAIIVGNIFACAHAVYALCLFYGAKLIVAGDVKDGGTILIVMFCCILASSSLVSLLTLPLIIAVL